MTAFAPNARAAEDSSDAAPAPPSVEAAPPSAPPRTASGGPSPVPIATAPSPPPPVDESLRPELARQASAIDALRTSPEEEKRARTNPVLRLSGFAQVDWIVHDQQSQNEINGSTGQPLNQDRFTLRRGHARIDAEKGPIVGAIEVDANTTNGLQVRPINAEMSVRWPERPEARLPSLMATIGLLRIPFGYEVQELDYVRPFLERSTMFRALFPGEFDLGLRLKVKYRFLDWALAVMNGSPIGDRALPALDPVRAKELVGSPRSGRRGWSLPSGSRRASPADTGHGLPRRDTGRPRTSRVAGSEWRRPRRDPSEIVAIGGAPATPSQVFHRFALGGDARLSMRPSRRWVT